MLTGDTLDYARLMTPSAGGEPVSYETVIDPSSDVDLYKVYVHPGQALTVTATTPYSELDPYLRVFNSSGNEVAYNDDGIPYTWDSQLTYVAPSSAYLYVGVTSSPNNTYDPTVSHSSGYGGSSGSYRIELSLDNRPPVVVTDNPNTHVSDGFEVDDANHDFTWYASDPDRNLVDSDVIASLQKLVGNTWTTIRTATGLESTLRQYKTDGLGIYRLHVTATDANGLSDSDDTAWTEVRDDDTSNPSITFVNAVNQSDAANNAVWWSIADVESGIASRDVRLYPSGSSTWIYRNTSSNTTTPDTGFNLNSLPAGEYEIWATARNSDQSWTGDQESSTTYTLFTISDDDTIAPSITLGGSSGTESRGEPQRFTWDVFDQDSGVGAAIVDVYKDGANIFHNSSPPAIGTFEFDDQGPGVFRIDVWAEDADNDWSGDGSSRSDSRTVTTTNGSPMAEADSDRVVIEGAAVTFDGTLSSDPDGDALSYFWDFGDGETAVTETPMHTYADDGAFSVRLTVDDGFGKASSDDLIVTVENAPPTINQVTNSGPALPGDTVTVTVDATDVAADPLVYDFDFDGDGFFEITDNTTGIAQHDFATSGVFPVNVRVVDGEVGGIATSWTAVQVGPVSGDTPAVDFDMLTDQEVSEDVGQLTVTATLAETLSVTALVPLTITGSAIDGSDYVLSTAYLIFPPGEMTATVDILVDDDDSQEPSETVTLQMNAPVNASLGTRTTHTITITDDDLPPEVAFATGSDRQEVAEDVGSIRITASLSEVSGYDVFVPLLRGGTAVAGMDYNIVSSSSITIPAGALTGSTTITIQDDIDPERNETVIFAMGVPQHAMLSSQSGTATTHTVIILENDAPSVSFKMAGRRVSESDGAIRVTAVLSNAYQNTVRVPIRTGGSATPGIDYTISPAELVFSPGQVERDVVVDVIDDIADPVAEDLERIILSMGTPITEGVTDGARLGTTQQFVLAVQDDDTPRVSIQGGWRQEFSEDCGTVTATVQMTNGSSDWVTVPILVTDYTAQESSDYQTADTTIYIASGQTSGSITIPIINDAESEETESFYIRLDTSGLDGVLPEQPTSARIDIVDDDPIVSLILYVDEEYTDSAGLLEDDSPAEIVAYLSAPTNKPVTVYLQVDDNGTAELGSDYTVGATSMTIAAGEWSASSEVAVLVDGRDEPRFEYARIAIADATNALVATDQAAEVDFTIFDIDGPPTVQFTSSRRVVSEDTTEDVAVTLRLSAVSDFDVTVPVFLGGTGTIIAANRGGDYEIVLDPYTGTVPFVSGAITIKAGDRERAIPIQIVNNTMPEDVEGIAIQFIDSRPGIPDSSLMGTYELIITDDDRPPTVPTTPSVPIPISVPISVAGTIAIQEPAPGEVPPLGPVGVTVPTGVVDFQPVGPFTLAIPMFGAISGATAFFDGNRNGALDFLDLDSDGIKDTDEPVEPSTITAANGVFGLRIPAIFDRDGDGLIGADEGQLVVMGGVDISTRLPLRTRLVGPIGCYSLSSLSTLMSALINEHGFTLEDAQQRVEEAMGLPLIDLTHFNEIGETLAGNPDAPAIFATNAKLQATIEQVTSFVAGVADAPPILVISDLAVADVAAKITSPEANLDLGEATTIETMLEGTLARNGLTVDGLIVSAAATLIAAGNRQFDAIPASGDEAFLTQVAKVQVVTQGTVAGQLAAIAAGNAGIETLPDADDLPAMIATAAVGTVVPISVMISDAQVVDPADGAAANLAFTVSLFGNPVEPVSIRYRTLDASATVADADYIPAAGELTWAAGDNSTRTVTVTVTGDGSPESDERVLVELIDPNGVAIWRDLGVGAIVNADPLAYAAPADGQPSDMVLWADGSSLTLIDRHEEVFRGDLSSPVPVSVTGADGAENTLTIVLLSQSDVLSAGLQFQGGDLSTDTLSIVDDTATEVVHYVTGPSSGTFDVDGAMISYSAVELVSDRFAPIITGMPTASIGEGTTIALGTVVADPNVAYQYVWNVIWDGDTSHPYAIGTEPDFVFTPSDDGEYLVRLTTSASGSATATAVQAITVNNVPPTLDSGITQVGPDMLDTTFGGDGKVTTDFRDSHNDIGRGLVAVQPDGKLVVAGDSSLAFAVARYNPDGSLDDSFGESGLVTSFWGSALTAADVALQADGRIVVGGTSNGKFVVVRYNDDGSLDTSFGNGGQVVTRVAGASLSATGIAIDGDKIVLAGYGYGAPFNGYDFVVARYNADGSLDTNFDSDGLASVDFGGDDMANDVAMTPSGQVIVAGWSRQTDVDFALARLNADGSLDQTFDGDSSTGNGKITTDFGSNDYGYAVTLDAAGNILVAGQSSWDFAVARYLAADGALDVTFDTDGKVTTDVGAAADAFGIALQTDGAILVAGRSYLSSTTRDDFAVARYLADGQLDSSLDGDGIVITDFGQSQNLGYDVVFVDDSAGDNDRFVVAGYAQFPYVTTAGPANDFALARYELDGTLDTSFGGGGKVITDFVRSQNDSGADVVAQPDGKVVVVGTTTRPGSYQDVAVVRYNADGTLDAGFGTSGQVIGNVGRYDAAAGVDLQADGKIVVAATADHNFAVLRYSSDGSADPDFGTAGWVTTDFGSSETVTGVAVQDDGKILVVGYTYAGGTQDFALARYNEDGSLDEDFGASGRVVLDFNDRNDRPNAIALQSGGKILVAGTVDQVASDRDVAVVRLLDDGQVDTSFGTAGWAITDLSDVADDAHGVAVDANGNIVVAAESNHGGSSVDFVVLRFDSSGTPDLNFGGGSPVVTDVSTQDYVRGLEIDSSGRIVVAGITSTAAGGSDFAVVRYLAGGTLDADFGTGGIVTTDFGGASYDQATGLAIDANDKIVVAGSTGYTNQGGTGQDFAVARYAATSGKQITDEGQLYQLPVITITDPGSNDPLHPDGPSTETFSAQIDWGDGSIESGPVTGAALEGSHTYADDGVYTVIVRVADDDMSADFLNGTDGVDFVEETIPVFVNNVAPSLTASLTPVWIEQSKLLAGDSSASAQFGQSVAMDGNLAVIGAAADGEIASGAGAAYVLQRNDHGTPDPSDDTWTELAKLTAGDGSASDGFGVAAGISGGTVVIGAQWDDEGSNANAGSAYVFQWDGSAWLQQAKLTADDAGWNDQFGASLAIDADTIVVGAPTHSGVASQSGAAYVFQRNDQGTSDPSDDTWAQEAKLTPSDSAANDSFGTVAIDGDRIVVGAGGADDAASSAGSAYVFWYSGSSWVEEAKLVASDAAAEDYLGAQAVAIDGVTVVVGAHGTDDAGDRSGSAYVFVRSGDIWVEQAKLTAPDGAAQDQFGRALSIDGDTVVVGERSDDDGGSASGSVYVFNRNEDLWDEGVKLVASDAAANDNFGVSVAVEAETILVGAFGDDDGSSSAGSAYTFGLEWVPDRELLILDAPVIDENGTVTLTGEFTDPGTLDVHDVVVSWGDGSADTVLGLTGGERTFAATHLYTDDPIGTPDIYTIDVTVTDNDGGSASGAVDVTVNNVPGPFVIEPSDWSADAGLTLAVANGILHAYETGTLLDVVRPHDFSGVTEVIITGRDAAADELTIDFSGANPIPSGGLAFDGGDDDNDGLVLWNGTFATVTHRFSEAGSGEIDLGAGSGLITFADLEPITDNLDTTNRGFYFGSGNETITLADDGVPDNNRSKIDSSLSEDVTFTDPTSRLTVNTGAGDDLINVLGVDSNFEADLTLEAINDSDAINFDGMLDFSGALTAVANRTINVNGSIRTNNNDVLLQSSGQVIAGDIDASDGVVRLISSNDVSQTTGSITANGLRLGGAGTFELTHPSNDVDVLTASTLADLSYRDVDDLTVGTVDGQTGVTSDSGLVTLTTDGLLTIDAPVQTTGNIMFVARSGDILLRDTAADDGVSGQNITMYVWSGAGTFTSELGSLVQCNNGLTIRADSMQLDGSLQSGYVDLNVTTGGNAIDLGSMTNAATATLELSDAELSNITANKLRIGQSAGSMVISEPISLDAVTQLWLWSDTDIVQTETASISQEMLIVEVGGDVVLDAPNDVETVALKSTDGNISFTDVDDFWTVRTDGTPAISAVNGSVSLVAMNGFLGLRRGLTSAGPMSLTADKIFVETTVHSGSYVQLKSYNSGQAIDLGSDGYEQANTLELSDFELDYIQADAIRVGDSTSGPIIITASIDPAAADTLHLISGDTVINDNSKTISVSSLAVEAGGLVNLSQNASHHVNTVAITTSGDIFFTNSSGFTIGEVDGVAGIEGFGSLLANSGDVLISDTSLDDDVRPGPGSGTFTIRLAGDDSLLTLANGARLTGSNQSYFADKIDLQGAIDASSFGRVLLGPHTDGRAINLGSDTDDTANLLELSDAELDRVTAKVLRIGSVSAGPITVTDSIAPLAIDTLHLSSGSSVSKEIFGGGSISGSINNLAVDAIGNVALTSSSNNVDTIAIHSITGLVSYGSGTGYSVGSADGIHGIVGGDGVTLNSQYGDITVTDTPVLRDIDSARNVVISVNGNDRLFSIQSGAEIYAALSSQTIVADKMDIAGALTATEEVRLRPHLIGQAIDLGSSTDNVANMLELSNEELNRITADPLRIGYTTSGALTITEPIHPMGIDTLHLVSGGTVTQSAPVAVSGLAVDAGEAINLQSDNDVDMLALRASSGEISFVDQDEFAVGTVGNQAGVVASAASVNLTSLGGDILVNDTLADNDLDTGSDYGLTVTLTLADATLTVADGAVIHGDGSVTLSADRIKLAGSVTAGANRTVVLRPWTGGRQIDLGSMTDAAANTLELSDAELDRIIATSLQIGSNAAGSINVSQSIAPANTNPLVLTTGGGVTQEAEIVGVGGLAVQAGAAVTLDHDNNDFRAIAIKTTTGNVTFVDRNALVVGFVYTVKGITATSGSVQVTARDGDLTLARDVIATGRIDVFLRGDDATFTMAPSAHIETTDDDVTVKADEMVLGGTIAAPGRSVRLSNNGYDKTLHLGGNPALDNTLELSDEELDRITARTMELIAGTGHSSIEVAGPISLDNVGTLKLSTNFDIFQSGLGSVTSDNLSLYVAYGEVQMSTNVNEVNNLAIYKGFSTYTGDAMFRDATGFSVTNVSYGRGVYFPGGSLTLIADSGDVTINDTPNVTDIEVTGEVNVNLSGNDAMLRIAPGASVVSTGGAHNYTADKMDLQGSITAPGETVTLQPTFADTAIDLGSATNDVLNTLELSDSELDRITADSLRIGDSTSGPIRISQAISPVGTSTLELITGSGVSQTGPLSIPNLAISAVSSIDLSGPSNDAERLAAQTTTGSVLYADSNGFIVDEVNSVTGLQANLGSLVLDAGGDATIDVMAPLYAGDITLNSGRLVLGIADAMSDSAAVTLATGASIDLFGHDETIGSLAGDGSVALGAGTLTTGGNNVSTSFSGVISGSGGLTKEGGNVFTLAGANTYTGETNVSTGTALVDGSLSTGPVTVADAAKLGGVGTIGGPVAVLGGAYLAPGPGPAILSTRGMALEAGSNLVVQLDGTIAGEKYDQLKVTGAVSLGGATLEVSRSFVPDNGTKFTLIANDGVDPVTGTFEGLNEGDALVLDGREFTVSYASGDGNDVVMTAVVPEYNFSQSEFAAFEGNATNTSDVVRLLRSGATNIPSSVDVVLSDITALAGSDFAAGPISVSFSAGDTSKVISIEQLGDTIVEPDETVGLSLADFSDDGTAGPENPTAILKITNDDSSEITISSESGNEDDGPLVFAVALTNPADVDTVITHSTADGSASTADNDYTGQTSQSLIIPAGQIDGTITVTTTSDTKFEPDETFTVTLTDVSASGRSVSISNGIGNGIILNDDVPLAFTISDVTHTEGDSLTTPFTFTVELSSPTSQSVSVNFTTADGTASGGGNDKDYIPINNGTITFAANETSKTISVEVVGETLSETDETFFVNLSNPSNGVILDGQGVGTITNDDAPPIFISIDDVTQDEGGSGTTYFKFTVSLTDESGESITSSQPISVDYATEDGTATGNKNPQGDDDYKSTNDTLTIAAGQPSETFTVEIVGDDLSEIDETFFVELSSPANGVILDGHGVGTIANDDVPPIFISIDDVTQDEGGSGTTYFKFTVSLTDESGESITSSQPISVDYVTADGTATGNKNPQGDDDYKSTNDTLTIAAGQPSETFTVEIVGDDLSEIDETFFVELSNPVDGVILDGQGVGTITNDDAPPIFISIDDVTQDEGDSGTTAFTFTVSLSDESSGPIVVDFATADGTATSTGKSKDYTKINHGTLTFAAGELSKTITVFVNGDPTPEAYESFFVNLTDAIDAILADDQGMGTILDDDSALMAAGVPLVPSTTKFLDVSQVEPLLTEGITRWSKSGVDTVGLATVDIQVVNLPGRIVGRAAEHTISIDPTAAGHGWFIDSSPWDDSEFSTPGDQGEVDRLDLLTVLMHEVGHILGLEHTAAADELMAATFGVGVRKLPTTDETLASITENVTAVDLTNVVPPFAGISLPGKSPTSAGNVDDRLLRSEFGTANESCSSPSLDRRTGKPVSNRLDVMPVFDTSILDRLYDDHDEPVIDDELLELIADGLGPGWPVENPGIWANWSC